MTQVRNVDLRLWRKLRAEAALRGIPVGQLLNEILRVWLKERPAP